MNTQIYFPAQFKKCKCTKARCCTFPCHTNGVAAYIEGDTKDDEENQTFTYLYCFQQHPMETWQIPIEELDTDFAPPPSPEPKINLNKVVEDIKETIKRGGDSKYAGITPIVLAIRNDNIVRAHFKVPANKSVSYDKAVIYLYKADIPANHRLYASIMTARDRLKDIIRKAKLTRNDAEESILNSLAVTARKEKALLDNKSHSNFPSPVAIDQTVTGGGWT